MSNEFKFHFTVGRTPLPMKCEVVGKDDSPHALRGKVVEFDVSNMPNSSQTPGCISLVKNTPSPDAPLLPVPDGLTQCSICREYQGVMALKDLPNLDPSFQSENPNTPLRIQCICDGIVCPCCNTNLFHKPGTNVWEERAGFQHVPDWRGLFPCDDCNVIREAQATDDRNMKMEKRRESKHAKRPIIGGNNPGA
jgi:hypothetical protein